MRSAHGSSNHHQAPNPSREAKERKEPPCCTTTRLHRILRDTAAQATAMEMMASSSAPATSYYNVSVAQAVLTLSINAVLVWLTTFIKKSSSSSSSSSASASASSSRHREAAPAVAPAPPSPSPAKPAAGVDMDVVLGLMGADAGAVSVGFEEAAALFEEEEATVEEAREAFAVFDRNGDGFIDAAELRSVLTSLGFQAAGGADAECQRMIDAYDHDKDGRIDFQEFVNLMETTSH